MNGWLRASVGFVVAAVLPVAAMASATWTDVEVIALINVDDDVTRNVGKDGFFDGIMIGESRFSENGFDWHLIRFVSTTKPEGPNWVVPHDDENAAFDAMIRAIHKYGGTGIAVNSGQGSARVQSGNGICGAKAARASQCDPNRNFDAQSPIYTLAFLDSFRSSQPVIALHTNSHGFSGDGAGGRGDITIYDRKAFARGGTKVRKYVRLAVDPAPEMDNPDTFALSAFLKRRSAPSPKDASCGAGMASSGVHFWHEPVGQSDGSLSNYLVLNRPSIAYVNAESRVETDLALAASRHAIMIDAYIAKCAASGDKPAANP